MSMRFTRTECHARRENIYRSSSSYIFSRRLNIEIPLLFEAIQRNEGNGFPSYATCVSVRVLLTWATNGGHAWWLQRLLCRIIKAHPRNAFISTVSDYNMQPKYFLLRCDRSFREHWKYLLTCLAIRFLGMTCFYLLSSFSLQTRWDFLRLVSPFLSLNRKWLLLSVF